MASPGPMKIYFCDICNESIPLKDINSNRISIEEGKIICQRCAPRRDRGASRVPAVLIAGVGLLAVATVGLAAVLWTSLESQGTKTSDLRQELDTLQASALNTEDHRTAQKEVLSRIDEIGRRMGLIESELGELRGQIAAAETRQGTDQEALRRRLDDEVGNLEARFGPSLDSLSHTLGELRAAVGAQGVRIESQAEAIDRLRDDLSHRGERDPVVAGPVVTPTDDGGAVPDTTTPDPSERETNALIAKLSDADSGVRYDAVVRLGRYRGDKVSAALEQRLEDDENYIRVAAIQSLKKMGAVRAVPKLIEALRDDDHFVMVAAAGALVGITSHEIAFRSDAPQKERERAAKAWEAWWEANKNRLLAEGL